MFSPLDQEDFSQATDLRLSPAFTYLPSRASGGVLQTVARSFRMQDQACYSPGDTSSTNGIYGDNKQWSGTSQCIVDSYQLAIRPRRPDSQILVRMSLWLAGERGGPSGANAAIGFYKSAASSPSLSAGQYVPVSNAIYTHRQNHGLDGELTGQSSLVEYPHAHGIGDGEYAVYTLLLASQYDQTENGGGYVFGETMTRNDGQR
jgi:hypothetical protein